MTLAEPFSPDLTVLFLLPPFPGGNLVLPSFLFWKSAQCICLLLLALVTPLSRLSLCPCDLLPCESGHTPLILREEAPSSICPFFCIKIWADCLQELVESILLLNLVIHGHVLGAVHGVRKPAIYVFSDCLELTENSFK